MFNISKETGQGFREEIRISFGGNTPGGWSNLCDLLPVQRAWGLMQKIAKSNGVLTPISTNQK